MLIDSKKKLKLGMKVNLILIFEDGSQKKVLAAVR
jgi:copper(I)-binding protein